MSIIPRGIGALGYTIQRPTEDRYLMTRAELENRMAVLMGGRAAEYVVFSHFSTGAADDLAKIADIARSIVTRYAMEPELGHVAFETDQRSLLGPTGEPLRQRLYGDDTAREIDCAVRKNVLTAFERATSVLTDNRDVLEESARLLLEKETLDTPDLERLFKSVKPAAATFTPAVAPCTKRVAAAVVYVPGGRSSASIASSSFRTPARRRATGSRSDVAAGSCSRFACSRLLITIAMNRLMTTNTASTTKLT